MWRGTEIPDQIKSHDSYDYSEYKPLNVDSAEDRELIESFWLNTYINIYFVEKKINTLMEE